LDWGVAIYKNCAVGNITNKNKNKKQLTMNAIPFDRFRLPGQMRIGKRIEIHFIGMNLNAVLCLNVSTTTNTVYMKFLHL
jgi:hypothetical protein